MVSAMTRHVDGLPLVRLSLGRALHIGDFRPDELLLSQMDWAQECCTGALAPG
jgi:hypothetical protein